MKFVKESELEKRIRELLEKELENNPHFSVLESKKVTDIVICREDIPRAFFLEVKLHTSRKGRMGIGEAKGKGFQPDIIKEKHQYFEKYLRWVLCNDEIENERKFVFASTETIRKYIMGRQVGQKQNNISPGIFDKETLLTETNLIERLISWLKTADYMSWRLDDFARGPDAPTEGLHADVWTRRYLPRCADPRALLRRAGVPRDVQRGNPRGNRAPLGQGGPLDKHAGRPGGAERVLVERRGFRRVPHVRSWYQFSTLERPEEVGRVFSSLPEDLRHRVAEHNRRARSG